MGDNTRMPSAKVVVGRRTFGAGREQPDLSQDLRDLVGPGVQAQSRKRPRDGMRTGVLAEHKAVFSAQQRGIDSLVVYAVFQKAVYVNTCFVSENPLTD